ncbi:olfactomedin-like protein 2A [Centruroides sculpturatus]|uniref:olfactomedin-like protein 2A n=1 Tax=Centruroides sculpturatus TaxID=218467 RepID=UPI000C6DDB08|nr:olfactomedin-like protein 2A [Centruroides sculpturatus]
MNLRSLLFIVLLLGFFLFLVRTECKEEDKKVDPKVLKNSPIHLVQTLFGFPFRGQAASPLFSLVSPFHRLPFSFYNKTASTTTSTTSVKPTEIYTSSSSSSTTTTTTTTTPTTTKPPPPSDVPQLLSKSSDSRPNSAETSKTIYIPLKFVSNAKPYRIVVQDPQTIE